MNRMFISMPLFFSPDGDPGAPAPSASPAAATPAAPAAPVAAATPQATSQAPATGVPEDRSTWVPPYRLRETRESALREAQSRFEQEAAQIRAEADRYRTQLQALVGVTPPANPEVDAVRSQFAKLYPGLAKMEEKASDMERLLERGGDFEAQSQHYWQTYAAQTMDRLFGLAQDSLGAPLTDEGKRQLYTAFSGYVSSSPDLSKRYASDPTVVADFWKQFTSSFIDPVRRAATAGAVARVPGALPQDSPSGSPQRSAAPAFGSLDERVAAGWAKYNQG